MAPLNIVIVGAGIGGPAAAIGLARNGHNVTIYERAQSTSEVGYAFRITPNSEGCLQYLGINSQAGGAVEANAGSMMDLDGNVTMSLKENKAGEKRKGTSVFASRPALNKQLMDAAVASGVQIHTGVKVKSVDSDNTTIILENGSTVSADLVIASDGVQSVVRSAVVDTARYKPGCNTGHNAFRFMIPKSVLENDELTKSMFGKDCTIVSWAGNHKRILVYPVEFGELYNVTCTHRQELSDGIVKQQYQQTNGSSGDGAAAVAYNQKIPADKAYDLYSEFNPVARQLFLLADPEGFRVWKLMDMEDLPNWSRNHTVLLGDACHPVVPFGFSGASMAIEDALTLVVLLPKDVEKSEITSRLKLYENIRRPRVNRVREQSRRNATDGVSTEEMMNYMKFLMMHDPIAHAREELARFLKVKS